jgi:hypothetical protein
MLITFSAMITFSLLSVSFSSIFYILIFGALGLAVYAVGFIRSSGTEERK